MQQLIARSHPLKQRLLDLRQLAIGRGLELEARFAAQRSYALGQLAIEPLRLGDQQLSRDLALPPQLP